MADMLSTVSDTTVSVAARNRSRMRTELLDAAVLVVIDGDEPTMRAVAARAGVGERTIYRYFASREGLRDAVAAHLRPLLGVPLCETADELETYAERLFDRFEDNRELTIAFVGSGWSRPELAASRTANLTALRSLLESAHPAATAADLDHAAASLRTVLSGAGWVYQRESCGLSPDEVVATAIWLIRLVRRQLAAAT